MRIGIFKPSKTSLFFIGDNHSQIENARENYIHTKEESIIILTFNWYLPE